MKQHKWHKEIKAWADGQAVQIKLINMNEWIDVDEWHLKRFGNDNYEFRIKPQPKEPQYLYVYQDPKSMDRKETYFVSFFKIAHMESQGYVCVAKIKLEVEDDK